jgi:two-component system OmpR family sensor kinase
MLSNLNILLHSIRFRLALWFVFILAVLLTAFSSLLYYMQVQQLQAETLTRLESRLEGIEKIFGMDAGNMLTEEDHGFATNAEDEDKLLQEDDVLILYRKDGTIQKIWGPFKSVDLNPTQIDDEEERKPLIESLTFTIGDDEVQYTFKILPLSSEDESTGYLAFGTQLDPTERLKKLVFTLITLIGLTLLISFAGGFWLADRAMRPVKMIASKAQLIGETDLSQRFNLKEKDEIGQLAGTFDSMLARLEAAFARQRQFTADASHELRTPLTIINLETAHALSAPQPVKEYQRVLKVIQSENELMKHLIQDLLTLARMDARRDSLHKTKLDLSDLALEVVERLTPLAARNKIKLEPGELPEVLVNGDRQSLIQMLTNLVENAIKYTAQNTDDKLRHVRVETGTHPSRTLGWVRVTDTGPGIPSQHLDHLFDRFYRVDQSRTRNEDDTSPTGSGLGLAIVEGIAKLHGGSIKVESKIGDGTTFEITFPLNVKP